MVYDDMTAGKLNLKYVERLEKTLKRRWPPGERPPSIRDPLLHLSERTQAQAQHSHREERRHSNQFAHEVSSR